MRLTGYPAWMLNVLLTDTAVGIIAWLGTIIALIGLPLTYKPALKARRAADRAQTAASAAANVVLRLEGRVSISDLAYANAQLDKLRDLATRSQYPAGLPLKIIRGGCELRPRLDASGSATCPPSAPDRLNATTANITKPLTP